MAGGDHPHVGPREVVGIEYVPPSGGVEQTVVGVVVVVSVSHGWIGGVEGDPAAAGGAAGGIAVDGPVLLQGQASTLPIVVFGCSPVPFPRGS